MVTKKINLKIWENNYVTLHTEKGEVDSRYIEVSFKDEYLNNLSLSGKSVTFYAQKPDKTQIFNVCTVNTTTNTATVELTSEALNMAGILSCEFQIFDSNNVLLKVGGLKVIVDSEIDFNEAAESSSSADVITVIMNSIGNLSSLTTTQKSNLVGAINELDARVTPVSKGGTGGTTASAARTNLEVMKAFSIYSNSSGTQGTVSFNTGYTTAEFEYIRVFYKVEDKRADTMVKAAEGNKVNLITAHCSTNDSYMYINARTMTLSASSLIPDNAANGYMRYKSSGGTTYLGTDIIYITDVIGYKY